MNVEGKWNISMSTPIGTQKFTWELTPAGAGWKGTMVSQAGPSELTEIRVDGASVGCNSRVNSPMGAIDLQFSGSVTGDQISGTCKTLFGDQKFSGQRG
jgi:hypothetical protein